MDLRGGVSFEEVDGIAVFPVESEHARAQAAHFDEEDDEFETERPRGTTPLYAWLIEEKFRRSIRGIAEVVSAPASPWQNPYVERVIGSIRRECLDHVIVLNESHLRRVLMSYLLYYHRSRTHLALAKDTPDRRPVAETSIGPIIAVPEVGGLHHRYERRAA